MKKYVGNHTECSMNQQCKKYETCPMVYIQDMLSGKWKMLILWYLSYQTLRFSDLQRKLPDVSQKVLSSQLKSLEAAHLIHKKIYPVVPPKVEYSLTPLGRGAVPILESMHQFGVDYLENMPVEIEKEPT